MGVLQRKVNSRIWRKIELERFVCLIDVRRASIVPFSGINALGVHLKTHNHLLAPIAAPSRGFSVTNDNRQMVIDVVSSVALSWCNIRVSHFESSGVVFPRFVD